MRVLVVENDSDAIAFLTEQLATFSPVADVTIAVNRDDAMIIMDKAAFDVAILDLRIPPSADDAIAADSHGMAVFGTFASKFPHSPVVLFTGYASFDVSQEVLHSHARGRSACFGLSDHAGVYVIRKENAAECLSLLTTFNAEIDQLESVEIDIGAVLLDLGGNERRILKVAAKHFGAVRVEVTKISGGLSGSKTLRFLARDDKARARAVAIAKIAHGSEMAIEESGYNQHIVPILPSGSFANLMRKVSAGGTAHAGLFYRLAEAETHKAIRSLFDVIEQDPETALRAIANVRQIENGWTDETTARRPTLGELRRNFISDADFEQADGSLYARVQDIEKRQILVRECAQHGDMHGENILVRPDGSPLLIDFGMVGVSVAGLDPTILELSLLTHEKGRTVSRGWPNTAAAGNWTDIEAYVRDAPANIARVVRECRSWATAVAGGYNAVTACAYAYVTRQLKYADVDQDAIKAIVEGCRARLLKV